MLVVLNQPWLISTAPAKIALQLLLNPNVLVKRIGSFKHANWELELLLNATATIGWLLEIIHTPLLMLTVVLNQ
jgi:hypothetical protein